MHGLSFHVGTDFRAEGLLGYQVHRETQKVLNVELHAEVGLRSSRTVEADQYVHVAPPRGLIPGIGAKQSEPVTPNLSTRVCLWAWSLLRISDLFMGAEPSVGCTSLEARHLVSSAYCLLPTHPIASA